MTTLPSRGLLRDNRAVAAVEFALTLPVFLTLTLTGAELINYSTTKMRISQVALHLADHAARIGAGSPLAAKTITETMINDTLTGAGLQAKELELYANGRVIVSSLEPVANPNPTNKFKIAWQRCRGSKAYASSYGTTGATNLDGMGPSGRLVKAPENGATMFVEVSYTYQPVVSATLAPSPNIVEIAAMPVRDTRDLTQIKNTEGAPVASCS